MILSTDFYQRVRRSWVLALSEAYLEERWLCVFDHPVVGYRFEVYPPTKILRMREAERLLGNIRSRSHGLS